MYRKRQKPREPAVPLERYDTIRRRITALLRERPYAARELSIELHVTEKDVYDHLEHIRKTLHKSDLRLVVVPAACERCGFVFKKRERLKKPGKCPICHGESVREPVFSVEALRGRESGEE